MNVVDLMDTDTGNMIGSWPNEEEGRKGVQGTVEANGDFFDDLAVLIDDRILVGPSLKEWLEKL